MRTIWFGSLKWALLYFTSHTMNKWQNVTTNQVEGLCLDGRNEGVNIQYSSRCVASQLFCVWVHVGREIVFFRGQALKRKVEMKCDYHNVVRFELRGSLYSRLNFFLSLDISHVCRLRTSYAKGNDDNEDREDSLIFFLQPPHTHLVHHHRHRWPGQACHFSYERRRYVKYEISYNKRGMWFIIRRREQH